MRFTFAWAETLAQNTILKWLLLLMSGLTTMVTVGLIILAQRNPIIVERGCVSKVLGTVEAIQTNTEVKSFVIEALKERYDSASSTFAFLSKDEREKTQKDRDELASKKIRQNTIIHGVDVREDRIAVDADRVIAIDDVRTAFKFPLEVKIATTTRSERNPYGLVMISSVPIQLQGK